jgi:hypothetical protein
MRHGGRAPSPPTRRGEPAHSPPRAGCPSASQANVPNCAPLCYCQPPFFVILGPPLFVFLSTPLCHSEPLLPCHSEPKARNPSLGTSRSLASLGMTSEPRMTSEPGLMSERGMAGEPGMTGGDGLALAATIRKRVPIRGASPSFRAETATVSSLPDQGCGSSECVWSGDISRWGSSKAPKLHADPPGPEGRRLAAHRMRAFGPSCGAVP